jgi:flagellar biosynthesis component FlhA
VEHPLSLLIARYGQEHGLYLFGEWSALRALGPDAYFSRHSPLKVAELEAQLAPLDLWPFLSAFALEDRSTQPNEASARMELTETASPGPGQEHSEPAALDALRQHPLTWVAGVDLYDQEATWAETAQAPSGSWFETSRVNLSHHWGFVLPSLRVRLEPELASHRYRLEIWGEVATEGEAFPGLDCILAPDGYELPQLPYPWTPNPAGAGWALWMPIGPASLPPVGLERIHWLTYVERHISSTVHQQRHRLLLEDAVASLLIEARRAGYNHELERYVSLAELRRVFRQLLAQGIPLRPLPPMLEAMLQAVLSDLAGRTITPGDYERLGRRLPLFSTERLVNVVRQSLGLPPVPQR